MASGLVAIYARRIRKGKMTIEEVPTRWKAAVQAELAAQQK